MKGTSHGVLWASVALATGALVFAATGVNSTSPLPFLGNSTILGAGSGGQSALIREADCSITRISFYPAHIPAFQANYQSVLHQTAGLTSTAGSASGACTDPTLGVASNSVAFLGRTSGGLYRGVAAAARGNDLVLYSANPSTITLTTTTLATNVNPQVLAIDLNRDGIVDIVASGVTDSASHVTGIGVFLGNVNGTTFQAPTVYPVPTLRAFLVDDVNRDGFPDIIVPGTTGGGTNQLATLLNTGSGAFSVGPVTSTAFTDTLVTGDFNGDGRKDVLTSDGVLRLGNGDGSFAAGTQALPAGGAQIQAMAAGDFNGDATQDVAVLIQGTGGVTIYAGSGSGTFTQGSSYASTLNASSLLSTDLDRDGRADLVVGRGSNGAFGPGGDDWYLQILMGRGNGTFVGAPLTLNTAIGAGGAGSWTLDAIPSSSWFAAADFDGDGKPDLLAPRSGSLSAPSPTGLSVAHGNGDGTFATPVNSATTFVASVVAATDVNADGKQDAVFAGYNGTTVTVGVLTGAGNGSLGSEADYPLPAGSGVPAGLAIGDFNGDGAKDIAVALIGGTICGNTCTPGVYTLLGKPDHTFQSPVRTDTSNRPLIATGDLDGNGRSDLVVADAGVFGATPTPGLMHFYYGNANGSFTALDPPGVAARYRSGVTVTDINHDGLPDVVTGSAASVGGDDFVETVVNDNPNGGSNFVDRNFRSDFGVDPLPTLAVGDFDGDTKADVAYFIPGGPSGILYGSTSGDGTLTNQDHLGISPANPGGAFAIDLNGDGRMDILVGDRNARGVIALVNQASAVTTPSATSTALTAAPNPATAGQSVTLTATVTATGGGTPSGSVTFFDGGTSLGSGTLSAQGVATLAVATLATASHAVTASYAGNSSFAASTSSAVAVVVSAAPTADFTLTRAPVSQSVAAGQSATSTLTLTPSGGFSGTVTLACSGLPSSANCAFAPASVALGASAATSTVTISTTVRSALNLLPGGGLLLAGLLVPMLPRRRRLRLSTRLRAGSMLFGALLLASCGGGGGTSGGGTTAPTGTTAGSYTVTVTATSGAISHSVTFALTVT
jgi:hypothetical protein